ncbi:pyruvoyl-dependent arginine decarboxylase [Haloarchaeobius sp. FL176]|uniref:pyruvoyl-dependent arginine decarboxylase n=1 Tax=Haloarchaeobius sp. FL176 TaxID=2967129 RepID=UPI0021473BAB|nr:pyruvoyl-dependent arginine decarboxylase [Haloarchaeobius sp. FL176]
MEPIRIVWGHATGPTEMAAYDAALADAGVENYNLVGVSSVIPADATVELAGTAPDLGPIGNRLTVVEACATATEPGHVSAGLAWATSPDGGLFYEAAGPMDEADISERVRRGLAAGESLRDWALDDPHVRVESASVEPGTYTTAVVLAVYGESEPIL